MIMKFKQGAVLKINIKKKFRQKKLNLKHKIVKKKFNLKSKAMIQNKLLIIMKDKFKFYKEKIAIDMKNKLKIILSRIKIKK